MFPSTSGYIDVGYKGEAVEKSVDSSHSEVSPSFGLTAAALQDRRLKAFSLLEVYRNGRLTGSLRLGADIKAYQKNLLGDICFLRHSMLKID